MKKRLWYLVLCALFLSVLVPAPALAADVGDFVVTGGTLGTEFTYASNVLTFIQPGTYTVSMKNGRTVTDKIQINAGTAADPVNLTLNEMYISGISNGFCALALQNTSYVNLTLEGTSYLYSGENHAGILCPQGASITIGGSGSLLTRGGGSPGSGGRGAGIGGNVAGFPDSGAITITGGWVGVVGGDGSAGIGGGPGGDGGTVTISGGTVSASAGINGGAGIGGGHGGSGGTVYISGGSVRAEGDYGEPIGMGYAGSDSGTLTDGPGGADVYLTTVTLDGGGIQSTAIHSLTTSATYGITGMQTLSSGILYLYLPESTHTTAAQTTDGSSPATIRTYTGDIVTNVGGSSGTLLLDTGGNTQHTGNTQNSNSHALTNNATGVTVSGPGIRSGTTLSVGDILMHEPGQCPACDAIRAARQDSDLNHVLWMDISLSRDCDGPFTVTIPVGAAYEGQTLTILHCADEGLETYTAVVREGQITFTVESLSPFAVYASGTLDDIPITGDTGSGLIWWLLCGVSAAGMAAMLLWRRQGNVSRQQTVK